MSEERSHEPPVPSSTAEVTGAWLSTHVDGEFGAAGITVTPVGTGFGLAGTILRVRAGDRTVVVKLWRADSGSGLREAFVHRRFGGSLGPRVPRCLYAAADVDAGRAVLVLEDLDGAVQGDCLADIGPDRAVALGSAFAALHDTWWRRTNSVDASWLPRSPCLFLGDAWFSGRVDAYRRRFGDRLPADFTGFITTIPLAYREATRRLATATPTVIHGDVHLDNVMFDAATGEPIILDWSHTAVGPGCLDLAELVLAAPNATDPLIDAYRAALSAHGVPDGDPRDRDAELAAAVVIALTRNTLGIAGWEPVSDRAAGMIDAALRRCETAWRTWSVRHPARFDHG